MFPISVERKAQIDNTFLPTPLPHNGTYFHIFATVPPYLLGMIRDDG